MPEPGQPVVTSPAQAARTVRQRRRQARSRRRPGAASPRWGERLGRWYLLLLTAAVVGPLVVAAALQLAGATGCTSPAPCLADAQRPALAVAVPVLLLGLLASGVRALGPLAVTAGEATWLLSTPAARGRLLLPALLRALLVAAAVGAAAGALTGLLAETGTPSTTALAPAALAGAALSVLVVCGSVLRQATATATGRPPRLGRAVAAAGALGTAAVVLLPDLLTSYLARASGLLGPGPWSTLRPAGPVAADVLPSLLLPLLLGAAVATGCAVRALDRLPLRDLLAAGGTRGAVTGAVLRLDTDVLGAGPASTVRRGPRRLPRSGGVWTALVVVGALAVTARPERLLDAAVLLVLPLLVAALLGTPAGLAAATAVATVLCSRTAAPLRALTRSASLGRSLPVDLRLARACLALAPGLAVLVWTVPATLVTGAPPWAALAVGGAALAGAVRSATPPPGDAGALVMTEAGPVPLGTVTDPLRGVDAAALALLPLLLGAPPWFALAAPVLVLAALLRSGSR